MPPKRNSCCTHPNLITTPSSYAAIVNFRGPTPRQLAAATNTASSSLSAGLPKSKSTASGKRKRDNDASSASTPIDLTSSQDPIFPAPLILPDDDLALDPTYPGQSFWEWDRMKASERNRITKKRNVIYVVPPPPLDPSLAFATTWTQPQVPGKKQPPPIPPPDIDDVLAYLAAYYHGLPVRTLAANIAFQPWAASTSRTTSRAATAPTPAIALTTPSNEAVRIRTRPSLDGAYAAQLNLDDLLDASMAMVPGDAFALLLLVGQDLYQSADDEFVCGLAYGGSRVCVVSMARYCPVLDRGMGVERVHAWPASHCGGYVGGCCAEEMDVDVEEDVKGKGKGKGKRGTKNRVDGSAAGAGGEDLRLRAAVDAATALPQPTSAAELTGLWLSRVCRTASHEVAHCFGIDHCVYYACNLQGSASIREDARQAPYLCPVDEAKVLKAIGAWNGEERNEALRVFCEERSNVGMWAGLGAWLGKGIEEKRVGDGDDVVMEENGGVEVIVID